MRTPATLLLLLLILGAFCVTPLHVQAGDARNRAKQKEQNEAQKDAKKDDGKDDAEEAKPREFDEDVLKAADDLRRTYTPEQQMLVNALRYLLRPAFETELMEGRRFRPCPLPPFEDKEEGPLSTLEELRLWAVLQSGLASTGATDRQFTRFFATPQPTGQVYLAPYGLEMLLCRAIFRRPKLNASDEAKTRAGQLLKAVNELKNATSGRSSLVQDKTIRAGWFANQMWLGLINRAALDMGLEIDDNNWENALKDLCASDLKDDGFVSNKNARYASGDLHTNLMAMAALGLAIGAPDGALGNSRLKKIKRQVEGVPALLARLEQTYQYENWGGSRLLLIETLPGDFAPERESGASWRDDIKRTAVSQLDPAGASFKRSTLSGDMGLGDARWSRTEGMACETALNCLALSGGLYQQDPAPLETIELSSIGRLMYALSVLHASTARIGGADFESRVNIAIEDGCNFLLNIQKEDGSFAGMYESYPATTAVSMLALLHGGTSRDSNAIQNGVAWLREHAKGDTSTYSMAIVLMFFQKYYEREQRETGIISADEPKEHEKAREEMWNALTEDDRKIVETLLKNLDAGSAGGKQGGWGYGPGSGRAGGYSDNSCSQFAMLGYKAASLLGAEIRVSVFQGEAERLIRQYGPDENCEKVEYVHNPDDREGDDDDRKSRATRTEWKGEIVPGGWGYACGDTQWRSMDLTAAGISSLTICMDELKVRGKLPLSLARKIGLTIRGAEVWTGRNYYTAETLSGERGLLNAGYGGDGHGVFYGLYSVERGCVLAGIRKLNDDVDWYRIGAEALIESQNMDGNWGPEMLPGANPNARQQRPTTINTAWAILFLKKAAPPVITEHKRRERERKEAEEKKDPKNPITSGPGDKKKDAEKDAEKQPESDGK